MAIQSIISVTLFFASAATAQSPTVFLARPGQVVALVDSNADGDFLDFAETRTYAAALPAGIGAIAARPNRLLVVDGSTGGLRSLVDLNGDGDALDFAEVSQYGIAPAAPPGLVAIACQSDDTCYCVDTASGNLIRFVDLNHDGDTLDFAEATAVASGLGATVALSVRPDGVILAALSLTTTPVMILQDRNADGDFFDFAESISYVENAAAGASLAAVTDTLAFLARLADQRVLALRDLTGDDDALDFGEVTTWAEGIAGASRVAVESDGGVLVACTDAGGSVWRLRDRNNDGDALDFGEALIVATGFTSPSGIAVQPTTTTCIAGDMNNDGAVDHADAPLLAAELLAPGNSPLCRSDVNGDGGLDGRDIRAYLLAGFP
ncbi:MAG: hypothetical protein HZA51_05905 [Planctomycetes bacterium]|nr:hypothetical protein [Planctomycetota bacterium]